MLYDIYALILVVSLAVLLDVCIVKVYEYKDRIAWLESKLKEKNHD